MSLIKNPHRTELHWQAGRRGLVGADAGAVLLEDKDFELSGGSAVDADVTYDADQGLALETAGGAVDQCILLPIAAGDNVSLWRELAWTTDNLVKFESVLRTDALKALMEIETGLVKSMPDPFDSGTDTDQVKFSYLQGTDTNWQINVSVSNSDTSHDTGVPVVAGTAYHFAIHTGRDRVCRCYINGRWVATTAALTTSVDLLPTIGVQAGSAATAVKIYVREMAISRELVA